MQIAVCLAAVLAVGLPAAHVSAAQPEASRFEQSRPLRPGPPRYLERYRFLRDPARRSDFFDPIRHIEINDSSWLQLGGGLRLRYDSVEDPAFGLRGVQGEDNYFQTRASLHADLHLLDDALRGFLQIHDTRSRGKESFSPFDKSHTEVHQAFVDFGLPAGAGDNFIARVGRQEMAYGSMVLTTTRDVPNVRLTFDGLRLSWAGAGGARLDAFAVRPVVNVNGDNPFTVDSFDDRSDERVELFGLYGTAPVTDVLDADVYAFSRQSERYSLGRIVNADEDRHTVGTRLFGDAAAIDWSWDLIYQFGELAEQDIRAWAVKGNTGYTFDDTLWKPRLGLMLDMASGDDHPGDDESNTFDPLYPANGKFYGNASLTTQANLIAVGPNVEFSPHPDWVVAPKVLLLWRESEDDAAYTPGLNPIPNTMGVSGRRLGTAYESFVRWTPTANLTLDFEYNYYDVSDVIRKAGGQDTQFVSVRTSFFF